MPRLEDLSFSIALRSMGESEKERIKLISHLSYALLQNDVADPCAPLSSLNYKITYEADSTSGSSATTPGTSLFPSMFIVPLERIPTISTLTLTTCTPGRIFFFAREGTLKTNDGIERCRLREIRFSGCEDMGIEDLQTAVITLKFSGAWENLERVVVEYCDSLEYDAVLETVGKERLRYSR